MSAAVSEAGGAEAGVGGAVGKTEEGEASGGSDSSRTPSPRPKVRKRKEKRRRRRSSSETPPRRSRKSRRSRSRSTRSRSPAAQEDGCRLHIANLDESVSEHDLEDAFGRFGPISEIWLATYAPFYSFIVMKKRRDAEEAVGYLNGSELRRCRIRVSVALPRRSDRQRLPPPPPRAYGYDAYGPPQGPPPVPFHYQPRRYDPQDYERYEPPRRQRSPERRRRSPDSPPRRHRRRSSSSRSR